MAEEIEIYGEDGEDERPDILEITFASNPKLKVAGMGLWNWGHRRQVSRLSDGTYEGHLDALVKTWLALPDTDWNIYVRDAKTKQPAKMERTAEVVDGLDRSKPHLKAQDVAHIALRLGRAFYPDMFGGGLFELSAEGESAPPLAEEGSSSSDSGTNADEQSEKST